jgi:hypothetical protein
VQAFPTSFWPKSSQLATRTRNSVAGSSTAGADEKHPMSGQSESSQLRTKAAGWSVCGAAVRR